MAPFTDQIINLNEYRRRLIANIAHPENIK